MALKIIHITASYKPAYIYGGPIQSVGKLCEELCKNKEQEAKSKDGFQVFTTTANGNRELNVETGKQQNVEGVHVTYFKRWTKDHSHFSSTLLRRLRTEILRCAPDDKLVIHIHAWWNLVSVLSCLVAKWYQIPVILSPRGMLTAYTQANRNSIAKKIIHNSFGKRLLQYCHIHATSNQEQANILKIVQPKSISVIPNLVNLAKGIERKAKSEDGDFLKLIFLSRIEEKKGLELLFDALSSIEIPWMLTIAGSGDKNYVESLKLKVESLKLSDQTQWIGHVDNEHKFELMADHDLLVLTSYNENFANVVVESLSVGTSVLVSKNVGLADYVKNNELGWVCSLTSESIKNNLLEAFKDSSKRERIRNSAPTIVAKDFSDETLVEKYLELYQDILNKNIE